MSADNFIAVQKRWDMWHVWHEFASNDYPYPDGYGHRMFKSKKKALKYAGALFDELYIVEYGICSLPDYDGGEGEYCEKCGRHWRDGHQQVSD